MLYINCYCGLVIAVRTLASEGRSNSELFAKGSQTNVSLLVKSNIFA